MSRQELHISRREVLLRAGGLAAILFGLDACDTSTPPCCSEETLAVPFVYSTEKDSWLKPLIDAFNASNATYQQKIIQIIPPPETGSFDDGSFDVIDQILQNQIHPVAWSPASELEWHLLNDKWQAAGNSQPIIHTGTDFYARSLVQSPIVFAIWKDRAESLLSRYQDIDWDSIYDALLQPNGWGYFRHSEWGRILLGQTRPDKSNSGMWAIILMTYAYLQKNNLSELSLDVANSSALWEYIQVFEKAVNWAGLSSGTYFSEDVVKQVPSAHALTITYENLVLQYQADAQQNAHEALEIFYPGEIIICNHPFAILNASWVSDEQQQAARIFRTFLLKEPQQREALKYGFRPADASIQLVDSHNPDDLFNQFSQLSTHSIDLTNVPAAQFPSSNVVEALKNQWLRYNPNP